MTWKVYDPWQSPYFESFSSFKGKWEFLNSQMTFIWYVYSYYSFSFHDCLHTRSTITSQLLYKSPYHTWSTWFYPPPPMYPSSDSPYNFTFCSFIGDRHPHGPHNPSLSLRRLDLFLHPLSFQTLRKVITVKIRKRNYRLL